ncbi:FAD1 flavin adenine dinucleotide synthetase [Desmophyllum pertusum]|uniref:FAD1 flavin adenine dinucleotide synthetase n=1 Tax=Desmophyllum pertusum TaxID=174260 RepID=A0A9X0DAN8_9CNID|nr:FAD1 flavin adenine dinucleotide synthetase [Desmophyllum pertusum]
MADGMLKNDSKCTAGIIIIGDEILKGHTKDTNSHFLLKKLWSLGVKVGKVSVISDDVEEIAREVKKFSSRFSVVITTGGIGPTHDDVTMQGIAKAFEEDLVLNEDLKRFFLRKVYLSAEETSIASILDEVDEKFKGIVHLGSYPDFCNQEFKVKLTVESDNMSDLEEAWHYLLGRLPKDLVVRTEEGVSDASLSNCKFYVTVIQSCAPTPPHPTPPTLPSPLNNVITDYPLGRGGQLKENSDGGANDPKKIPI